MLLSASRDKTVMVWDIIGSPMEEDYAKARRSLRGHSHFVSSVVISSDGQFALSGSWDGTLRLWEIATGKTTRRFVGHEKDVLSVAFSADNRQIVSGSRDKTMRGPARRAAGEQGHLAGVLRAFLALQQTRHRMLGCCQFKPADLAQRDLTGHTGYLARASPPTAPSARPAAKRRSCQDLNEGKRLASLRPDTSTPSSSPNCYGSAPPPPRIKIWDLESKIIVDELVPEFTTGQQPFRIPCTRLCRL